MCGTYNLWSVPKTGTHFLKGLLEQAGQVRARHYEGYSPTNELVFSPIRNPADVWESWAGRNQDFIGVWETFNRAWQSGNVFVLPIDTQDRDERIIELSDIIGYTLETDWKPVNATPHGKRKEAIPDAIANLEIVRAFYS